MRTDRRGRRQDLIVTAVVPIRVSGGLAVASPMTVLCSVHKSSRIP